MVVQESLLVNSKNLDFIMKNYTEECPDWILDQNFVRYPYEFWESCFFCKYNPRLLGCENGDFVCNEVFESKNYI